jgi:hypothetical protein
VTNNQLAPICLFVYNRLDHTRRAVDSLKQNLLAQESDLIIFSDASKSELQAAKVRDVRDYISQINGFKSITIVERETNYGLAKSIIDGVTTVVNEYGRTIVLEDDLVTSPYFLTYMNEALEKYAEDDRVISIHGWVFPTDKRLPDSFFLLGADCWGWATWQRGWALFQSNGQYLLDELNRRNLTREFDCNGAYPYTKMLKGQIKGINDSWAIRWYASAFLAGKFTLYPGRSLVHNIGNDGSGTHCDYSVKYDVELSNASVEVGDVVVQVSEFGKSAFQSFLRKARPSYLQWIKRKLKFLRT